MARNKKAEDLQIVKKSIEGSDKRYLLKLNRTEHCLEVYEKVSNDKLYEYHAIREDFDSAAYVMFEKIKSMPCICGGPDSATPYGIFNVEFKSKDCYISGYHKQYDKVKFFGYLIIFEDYFIHSNMYFMDVDKEVMRNGKADCINVGDEFTSGCIRVKQEELDWLVSNIELNTIVFLS